MQINVNACKQYAKGTENSVNGTFSQRVERPSRQMDIVFVAVLEGIGW